MRVHERAAGIAGLIGASVWRKSSKLPSPSPVARPLALMMPIVTVWPTPERIAEGKHDVTDLDVIGIGERECGEVVRVDLQHRKIARRIRADQLRVDAAPIGELDRDVFRSVDHVVIGQDVAVGAYDDAGAERGLTLLRHLRPLLPFPEEPAERRIVRERELLGRTTASLGPNRDHCRRDLVHELRIGVHARADRPCRRRLRRAALVGDESGPVPRRRGRGPERQTGSRRCCHSFVLER